VFDSLVATHPLHAEFQEGSVPYMYASLVPYMYASAYQHANVQKSTRKEQWYRYWLLIGTGSFAWPSFAVSI
jgi:hypothetical protein